MSSSFESLENRTLFCVAILHGAVVPTVHPQGVSLPRVHKAPSANAPLNFQGIAYNTTKQKTAATVLMTLIPNFSGYTADVTTADANGRGGGDKLQLTLDTLGHFTLDRDQAGGTFHLEGQLNAEKTSITGTWSEVGATEINTGTFSLGRTTQSKINPKKAPAPVNNLHYVGLATDADGSIRGEFRATGMRPKFLDQLKLAGLTLPADALDPTSPL